MVLAPLIVTVGLAGSAAADLLPPKLKQPKPPAKRVAKSFPKEVSGPIVALAKGIEATLGELVVTKAVPSKGFTAEAGASAKKAIEAAAALGMTKAPVVTGIRASAVLWYGIVPMTRVDFTFWRSGDKLRLLRIGENSNAADAWFEDQKDPQAPGDPTLKGAVTAVMERIKARKCGKIPAAVGSDFNVALPSGKQARRVMATRLHGFRTAIPGSCKRLAAIPWERLTWTIGDVLAVGRSGAGAPVAIAAKPVWHQDGGYQISQLAVIADKKRVKPKLALPKVEKTK